MLNMMTNMIIGISITSLILFIATLLAKRTQTDREKLSPYECGFEPNLSARTPFSLRFFLLAVVFLVFDVEIILLLPLPLLPALPFYLTTFFTANSFLAILLLALIHEWRTGALEWS